MAFNQSQMAGPFDTDSMINLRVLAASTGVCYNVTLHPNELRSVFIGCKPSIALLLSLMLLYFVSCVILIKCIKYSKQTGYSTSN